MTTPRQEEPAPHPAYAARWDWFRFVLHLKLPAHAKVVAYQVAYSVNKKSGLAFPSQPLMAARSGVSDRQIRDGLSALRKAGLIKNHSPKGGLIPDGRGGVRGRVGNYELLRLNEVAPALAALIKIESELGSSVPSKPSQGGSDTPANPEVNGGIPGSESPQTRNTASEDLTCDLTSYPNRDLKNASAKDEGKLSPYFDGIDYSKAEQYTGEWPDDSLIRKPPHPDPSEPDRASLWITNFACRWLGYPLGARLDGQYPDRAIVARIPPPTLAQMIARNRAGKLTQREVAMVVVALGIPRGDAEQQEQAAKISRETAGAVP